MADPTLMAGILIIMLIIFLILFIVSIGILLTVFWILMIIDCAKRDFRDESTKVVWIVILVFFHVIAAIIYYFAVKRPEDRKKEGIKEAGKGAKKAKHPR